MIADRIIGSVLGLALGDAFGAPCDGGIAERLLWDADRGRMVLSRALIAELEQAAQLKATANALADSTGNPRPAGG